MKSRVPGRLLDLPKVTQRVSCRGGLDPGSAESGLFHGVERRNGHPSSTSMKQRKVKGREKHTGGVVPKKPSFRGGHVVCCGWGCGGLGSTTRAQGGSPGAPGLQARADSGSVKGAGRYWRCLNRKQKRMKD